MFCSSCPIPRPATFQTTPKDLPYSSIHPSNYSTVPYTNLFSPHAFSNSEYISTPLHSHTAHHIAHTTHGVIELSCSLFTFGFVERDYVEQKREKIEHTKENIEQFQNENSLHRLSNHFFHIIISTIIHILHHIHKSRGRIRIFERFTRCITFLRLLRGQLLPTII